MMGDAKKELERLQQENDKLRELGLDGREGSNEEARAHDECRAEVNRLRQKIAQMETSETAAAAAEDAIRRMKRSERGEYCLRQFLEFIDDEAHGLDSDNWGAVIALANYCRCGGAGNLLSATREFMELDTEMGVD